MTGPQAAEARDIGTFSGFFCYGFRGPCDLFLPAPRPHVCKVPESGALSYTEPSEESVGGEEDMWVSHAVTSIRGDPALPTSHTLHGSLVPFQLGRPLSLALEEA